MNMLMLNKKLLPLFNWTINLRNIHITKMANSRFEYAREYETDDKIIPNIWIVIRVDGKSFHKFSKKHEFEKPNDSNALNLMNHAAVKVMQEFPDIVIAYGQSDEFSFVFHKSTTMHNRRSAKLMSNVNSLFTSSYVYFWRTWFGEKRLRYPPCFDARVVLYPSDENLKDYLNWRQADVHVNNLYNTAFWSLVKKGLTNQEAEQRLCGTFSDGKNELLYSEFNINYNDLPAMFRKGTTLVRKTIKAPNLRKTTKVIIPLAEDLIKPRFWEINFEILTKAPSQLYEYKSSEDLPKLVYEQIKSKGLIISPTDASSSQELVSIISIKDKDSIQ